MRKISGPFLITDESERCEAPRPKPDSVRRGRPPLTKSGRTPRFVFTNLWCRDVLLGKVSNHDKLIAHGMKLLLGTRTELSMIPFKELLTMVQIKLKQKIFEDQKIRDTITAVLVNKNFYPREMRNGKDGQGDSEN